MSNYVKLATDAGDQYLASLGRDPRELHQGLDGVRLEVHAGDPVVMPPAFAAAAADVPTAQELTEASFAFAQKLLKQQKSFAEKLLAASTPAEVIESPRTAAAAYPPQRPSPRSSRSDSSFSTIPSEGTRSVFFCDAREL